MNFIGWLAGSLNLVARRMKKKKREFPTPCDGQHVVDPEIYFKTMAVIQLLKPTPMGRVGRIRHRGEGMEVERDEERQIHLPPIQTTTTDSGGRTRKRVVQRWQRAAAAVIATTTLSQSNSDCLTNVDATGM